MVLVRLRLYLDLLICCLTLKSKCGLNIECNAAQTIHKTNYAYIFLEDNSERQPQKAFIEHCIKGMINGGRIHDSGNN